MELKVVNALSRDVEREQLNKILKYISDSLHTSTESGITEAQVKKLIAESMPTIPAKSPITINVTGDVEGSGTGTTSISIPVELTKDFVEDAPIDSGRYWRYQGGWETVPFPLLSLAYMSPSGFGAYNEDDLEWNSRELQGTAGNITVTNGDGLAGDPVFDLSLVPDDGVAPTLYKIERDGYGRVTDTQAASASDVPIAKLGSATWDNVQEYINVMNSPGLVEGGGFSDAGSGNLAYTSMRIAIRPTDDDISTLFMADVPAGTVSIPNDSATRFVGVQYNSGSPNVAVKTTNTWDYDTEFPLGEVANLGGTLYPLFNPFKIGDPITNIIQRFDAQAYAVRSVDGGLELSTEGTTRNLAMTAGQVWTRLNDHDIAARDSTTSPLIRVTPTGGTPPLVFTPGVTTWPNTQYLSGTTLTTLGNNKWAVLWVFVNVGTGSWGFAHGIAEYNNSSSAAGESIPAYLTSNFLRQNILVGRLLFEKNATTAIIESAFTRVFSTQAVSNHNQLSGLQGGALNDYQHLTSSQIAKVNAIPSTTTDLPEGTNLYYTNARADARIAAQKGVANGLASLGPDAKLPANQLPALAITETFVVNSQAAMLALSAQEGDVAVRTDLSKSFILTASPASTLSNWQELLTPTGTSGTVTSVGLSAPVGFTVSGSPVTSSGTLTFSYSAGYQGYTAAESTKLSGIAAGATVGASWGTNLSGIPTNITSWAGIAPATKADDSAVVHRAGDEELTGQKTFTSPVKVQVGTPAPGMIAGADVFGTGITPNVRKLFRMALPSYNSAVTLPHIILSASTDGSSPTTYVELGGASGGATGVSAMNEIRFVTASTYGAIGGFARWAINESTLFPFADNLYDFGGAGNRPKQLWAANGTINTSDAREKTPVRPMTSAEVAAAISLGREVGVYKWLAMVAEKGDSARDHIGMTVQRAIEVMEQHSLDPYAYGFICYDSWESLEEIRDEDGSVTQEARPAGDRYSFRMDELAMFILAGQNYRIELLEEKLKDL